MTQSDHVTGPFDPSSRETWRGFLRDHLQQQIGSRTWRQSAHFCGKTPINGRACTGDAHTDRRCVCVGARGRAHATVCVSGNEGVRAAECEWGRGWRRLQPLVRDTTCTRGAPMCFGLTGVSGLFGSETVCCHLKSPPPPRVYVCACVRVSQVTFSEVTGQRVTSPVQVFSAVCHHSLS